MQTGDCFFTGYVGNIPNGMYSVIIIFMLYFIRVYAMNEVANLTNRR